MRKINILFVLLLLSFCVKAQERYAISVEKAIEMAKTNSLSATQTQNLYLSEYWKYRLYKASYLPELSLSSSLPNFNRTINSITLDNGTDAFITSGNVRSNVNLKLNQRVAYTGGNIFLNSGMQRIDVLLNNKSTSYLSTPFVVGYSQPLNGYNPYKWERKIAPVQYDEAKRKRAEDMETIALQAINYFFSYLDANMRMQMAENNKKNNEELFKVAQGRFNLGTIAENELLDMELSLLESENAILQSQLDIAVAKMNFSAYLGIPMQAEIELELPKAMEKLTIESNLAISKAIQNNRNSLQNKRMILEAEQQYAQAKSNAFDVNLFATYGLSGQSADLASSYQNTDDQQQFMLGIEVPILNWGKTKAGKEMSKSNLEYVMASVEQSKLTFEQQVFIAASEIEIAKNSVLNAMKADTIASRRYDITLQRYKIGTIDVTTFNLARISRDNARTSYYQSLRRYWSSYYNLRKLTLYDFVSQKDLIELE